MAGSVSPEILARLVEQHRRFLQFLEPRVGNRADAEEVLQAAFVKILERGGAIKDGESAVAWFYRLLRNALVDHWRHRSAERRALEREAVEVGQETVPPPELYELVCQCVRELVPTLRPEHADVLTKVDLEGRPVPEVAGALGLTPGNTAVRLHRARRALRERLELTCATCAEHGCLACTCGEPNHSAGLRAM